MRERRTPASHVMTPRQRLRNEARNEGAEAFDEVGFHQRDQLKRSDGNAMVNPLPTTLQNRKKNGLEIEIQALGERAL